MPTDLYDRITHPHILLRIFRHADSSTLASAIRVNKVSYDLAIPLLYRKVVLGGDNEELGPFAYIDKKGVKEQGKKATGDGFNSGDGSNTTEQPLADDKAPDIEREAAIDDVNTTARAGTQVNVDEGELPKLNEQSTADNEAEPRSAIESEAEETGSTLIENTSDPADDEVDVSPADLELYSVENILKGFSGLDSSSLFGGMRGIFGGDRKTIWRTTDTTTATFAAESVHIISVGAHQMGHLSHRATLPGANIIFDRLANLDVLHIASTQNLSQFEMQNPDAIGAFMREWVYCWHRRNEMCEMIKYFRPKTLVISDMPQLVTARLERFRYPFFSDIKSTVKHIIVIFAIHAKRPIDADDEDAPVWNAGAIIDDIATLRLWTHCKLTLAGLPNGNSGRIELDEADWESRVESAFVLTGRKAGMEAIELTARMADLHFVDIAKMKGEVWAEVLEGKDDTAWL